MTPRGERSPSGASDLMPILKKLPSSVQIETSCCFCSTGNPLLLLLIIGAALFIALLIAGIGFLVYRKRNETTSSSSELTERLNQPAE
ncbi:Major histocompatibility complex class I-related protein [Dissostichus eleginoides]|uniref:Major histocompatibility complex class I-related protein n=1 Tax=Dissostichus eleginoides TaxID=100907 RepID=A0AAD9EWB3_DISEL|nr:Major histocompatibility complex class I-related protein [Dissostichus eleginoides]